MASRAGGDKSSSTKLLMAKLLGDDSKEQQQQQPLPSAALDRRDIRDPERVEEAMECPPSPERREEPGESSSSLGTEGGGGGERQLFPGKTSSVQSILRKISAGSTIAATPWKLTRAVVHLEDAWKGRVSPCPPMEKKEPATRALFKLRWKYRGLEFAVVHLLLVLLLVEIPGWCIANGKCYWNCFPDFSRNHHMSKWTAMLFEGPLLLVLAAIALVDVHTCGDEYWSGSRKRQYQSMWFKHGIISAYLVLYLLSIGVDFRAHALCSFCRILLYLSVHRRTVLVVTQLRHILSAVAEIWVLIFLNILLFAWVGVILFAGTAEGEFKFPDLFEASWRLFVLFTTTNFPEIMMLALDQVRATIIYFAGFVILNVFFFAPLSLAMIFNVFRGGQSGIPRMEEEIRLESSAAAFALLDDRNTGQVSIANMGAFLLEVHSMRGVASREMSRLHDLMEEAGARTPEGVPSLNLEDFKDAVNVMDRSLRHAEWITEVQWYFPRLYQSPGFRRLSRLVKHQRVTLWPGGLGLSRFSILLMHAIETCLLVTSFVILMLSKSFSAYEEDSLKYDWMQMLVVLGFCMTVGVSAAVLGWHNCVQRPTWVFNAMVTFASVVFLLVAILVPGVMWSWRIMRALRVTHLALVVAFVPRLDFLIRTLLIMTKRAATPASVLLAWSFFMAVVGTELFGGLVCVPDLAVGDESCAGTTVATNTYTETGLMLLNFNDVPSSLVTLLVLFVVNDWYVIVDEFVDVTGTGWARAYFILNYIIGVAVILNLVVTVVINSFWDEYKRTNEPKDTLRQLHDAAAASANHHHPGQFEGTSEDSDGRPGTAAVCGSEEAVATADVAGQLGREEGCRWQGIPADEEASTGPAAGGSSEPALLWAKPNANMRRGSRDEGSAGGGSSQQSRPLGDEAGMEAERDIARRASRRRLNVSGIT
eukprot:g13891.t1